MGFVKHINTIMIILVPLSLWLIFVYSYKVGNYLFALYSFIIYFLIIEIKHIVETMKLRKDIEILYKKILEVKENGG